MGKTFKKLSVVKLSPNFAEATQVVEVPLNSPKDDEILVKNLYAGVNATDINISAGRYGDRKLPFDVGLESLGVIESVGKNVTDLKPGQNGLLLTRPAKSYSEYIYAQPSEFIPIKEAKPELLSLLVGGLTASIGLDKAGRIQKGDKVLITAAAGGTGHIAVQWAKRKGAHVIGTTSNKEKALLLKELGVDRVINYNEESLDDVLTKEYPDGVDVIWETIGGEVFQTLFNHLATNGRLVIIGGITGYKTTGFPDIKIENLNTKLLFKSASLNGFALFNAKEYVPEYLKNLIELVSSKELKVILDFGAKSGGGLFHGIDSVVRGVEYLHSGNSSGKVIIKL